MGLARDFVRTGTLGVPLRRAFDAKRIELEPFRKSPAIRTEKDGAITLRNIQPNEGVRAWYREQLQCMTRRMAEDILRKLAGDYDPALERMALDDDPIVTLRRTLRAWGRKWQKNFNDMSTDVARMFADRSQRHLDRAFRQRLKDAGFTVKFAASERQVSAYRAVIAENVNLIRSIPHEFLKDVQGSVWRSVMSGHKTGELSASIRKKYGISYRRAGFIARDQVAKAKAVMEQARRAELGIKQATWVHSNAGKVPRPTHVKMMGKRFDIAEGMYDSAVQQYIQPGELPNCRCTSRAIIPTVLARASS